MNKAISLLRIAALLTLLTVGLVFFFGEEQDQNLFAWTLHFLADKTLGAISLLSFAKLYKRWSRVDPWIIAYNKWCDKGLDNSISWEDEDK